MSPLIISREIESPGPNAVAVPILAGLAGLLCLLPLIVHLNARNFAAAVLVSSVLIINFLNCINAIIWPTEIAKEKWPGWGLCDVEIKLYIGCSAAVVGAVACIFRYLAAILDTNRATPQASAGQVRRRRHVEAILCLGVPVYLMCVHYIVQPGRYDLYELAGCVPSFDNSWPTYVLVLLWPVLLSTVAAIYCGVAAYRLIRYRYQFRMILSESSSGMSKSRFIRLFTFNALLILAYFPLSIFTFEQNLHFKKHPYSWKVVHDPNWSRKIIIYKTGGHLNFDRAGQITTGYLVFVFFGLGSDARMMYCTVLSRLCPRLLRGTKQSQTTATDRRHIMGSGSTCQTSLQTVPSELPREFELQPQQDTRSDQLNESAKRPEGDVEDELAEEKRWL